MTQGIEAEMSQPEATPLPPLAEPFIESRADFFRYYNQVSLADALDDLLNRFPGAAHETPDEGKTHTFIFDGGFGFAVAFDEAGVMQAKVPYYKDIRQLKPIAPGRNLDQAGMLNKGQSYAEVSAVFGNRGLEIMQLPPESGDAEGVRRLYIWMDANDMMVEALIDETGAFVSANAGTFE